MDLDDIKKYDHQYHTYQLNRLKKPENNYEMMEHITSFVTITESNQTIYDKISSNVLIYALADIYGINKTVYILRNGDVIKI